MTIFNRQDYERISRQCVCGVQYLPRLKKFMSCDNRVRGKDNLNPFTTMMNLTKGWVSEFVLGCELTLSKCSKTYNLVLNNRRFIYDDVISLKFFLEIFMNF